MSRRTGDGNGQWLQLGNVARTILAERGASQAGVKVRRKEKNRERCRTHAPWEHQRVPVRCVATRSWGH